MVKKMMSVFGGGDGAAIKGMCSMIKTMLQSGEGIRKKIEQFMGMESSQKLPIHQWLEQCERQGITMENFFEFMKKGR